MGVGALAIAFSAAGRGGDRPDNFLATFIILILIGGAFTLAGAAVFVSSLRARRRPITGPAIRVEVTRAPEGPLTATFHRLASTALDGVSVEGGGVIGGLVDAAIGTIAEAARDRGNQPEVMTVAPMGLSIPGVGRLPWSSIAEIRVLESELLVLPKDPSLVAAREPDVDALWNVRGGAWMSSGERLPSMYGLRLDMVNATYDDIVHALARHHWRLTFSLSSTPSGP